ncbi:hypothetical protein [Actinokineospora inagensis]|uniref:hypothetical protein n=1 Tax=Actinokineospora inagensis TaxID=103730 RepID=UPI0004002E40|nr:hypothetical protein [Actinokineospora inagensis]
MLRNPDVDIYAKVRPGTEISYELQGDEVEMRFEASTNSFAMTAGLEMLLRIVSCLGDAMGDLMAEYQKSGREAMIAMARDVVPVSKPE